MIKDKIFKEIKEKLPEIQKGVLLKNYTTYKIGGPAKYFFVAKTKDDLITALKIAKNLKLPVFVLGGGSNILVSEKGFKGLVIKIDISDIKFYPHTKRGDRVGKNTKEDGSRSGVGVKKNKVYAGAGANLTRLAYLSADNNLSGFEWSAGIPGTVGGAIHGNAHAFKTKTSDLVKEVETINTKTLKFKNFTKKQCHFSLKNSIFKKDKNLVIISAFLELKKEDADKIKNRIKEFIKHRITKHPMNFPSAGSTFVNPVIKIKSKKLLEKFPEIKEYSDKGSIPSGYLIEKSGLAGKRMGNAQISEKHCNFIINLGGAKSKDILFLMNLAKKKVKNNFGISLESEIQFIGF